MYQLQPQQHQQTNNKDHAPGTPVVLFYCSLRPAWLFDPLTVSATREHDSRSPFLRLVVVAFQHHFQRSAPVAQCCKPQAGMLSLIASKRQAPAHRAQAIATENR